MIFETKKELREQLEDTEERCVSHFMKLNKIENILRRGEAMKTPAVFIVDEIKEVIVGKNK